MLKSVGSSMWP